jgi:hypothetical protein
LGHLEKLLSLAIADSPGVNVNESERERSGIIRRQFCGVRRVEAIFRGALWSNRSEYPGLLLQRDWPFSAICVRKTDPSALTRDGGLWPNAVLADLGEAFRSFALRVPDQAINEVELSKKI